jgi:N-acetylglucosamine kinase-like BadF-type ATPase
LPNNVVLGVDGGGTWTRSVVMRLDGLVLGYGQAGPSNPITAGMDNALRNILDSVNEAGQASGRKKYVTSVLGLAGASRSRLGAEILSHLPESFGEASIVSDASSALAGATGCRPGVVTIAGTGSIAYGSDYQGLEVKAGGWGWRLGDEGSGYTIGKNALKAALRYYDQSGPKTMLKEMILGHLGLDNAEEIVDWAYDPGREPMHFAQLVPLVKEAEIKGDRVALEIMEDAGTQLGRVTQAVIRRLRLKGEFPLACIGGVFKQPNRYNSAFEETVRKVATCCLFIEPLFNPSVGSALLALKSQGVEINEDLLSNVRLGLKND